MAEQVEEQAAVENLTILQCNIEGGQVILPDISVAEIVNYLSTEADDDAPTWYLGKLPWRSTQVPVISLEALNSDSFFSHSNDLKIIIVNGMSAQKKLPYWGFVVEEAPKMQRISPDSLVIDNEAELGEAELMRAELVGEPVIIPDLDKIEKQIKKLL